MEMRAANSRFCLAAFLAALLMSAPAEACTTLCLRHGGRIVFGKNYDWNVADGMLMVNKRGVKKVSDKRVPLRWVSEYGSVTFNQYGRDNPMGGMNEVGLVIELMWLDGTRYPAMDARREAGELEWIQYQLDTAGTVEEVIASDTLVRIAPNSVPLHFLIADRAGNVATIEFIGGKLVAHTGDSLPVAALTNDFYSDSLRFMEKTPWLPPDMGSQARFVRAAARVKNFKSGDAVAYAFEALADVHSAITQWSIVYEVDRRIVHFRTQRNSQIKSLQLASLDFSCGVPVLVIDLHQNQSGDARQQLKPYTREANLALMRASYAQTEFLARTPVSEIVRLAALPDATSCRATSTPAAPAN